MNEHILKNGKEIIIRKANPKDAHNIIQYKSLVGEEPDYRTFETDEMDFNIKREECSIESINVKKNSLMAVALIDGEIVGLIVFRGGERNRIRHVGEMGITVRKPCWGLDIGGLLIGFLIEWAKETRIIRKINLRVRSDNENAIQLYKKYGFREEGMLTRDFLIDENLYDSISMGLLID
ncbi:Protein N-acetyltransferase, RimJ/RimL family [Peptoclostridium litorale DSM 5388]|uniref:GCN5-like N-acetyltransferase n=1 Tax=Peptoclostridium litorale DSM 5388 TaxID=1121324 RepID=A0A069RDY2_PEPLI|nr:GNAT family protein [Peptoclostridium litorale]KDR95236.1 GCN5-like N-acetyltransferase [Peptoclostridium litorale DSM 5388]SIN72952.1 Protein N-acetyltransferase, RimJ/RimL family [Peptoclostridium litorale DSM 5388]